MGDTRISSSTDPVIHLVHDYTFTFDSGQVMQFTVDPDLGDIIREGQETTQIVLTAKPSPTNPKEQMDAEDLKIFNSHVLVVQHRERQHQIMTPEQRESWAKVIQEVSKTVN